MNKLKTLLLSGLIIFNSLNLFACADCSDERFKNKYESFIIASNDGDHESADYFYFEMMNDFDVIPKFENTDFGMKADHLNSAFRSDKTRDQFKKIMIHSGMCCNESDIDFDERDRLTIKFCTCNKIENISCGSVDQCKENCTTATVALNTGCALLKLPHCVFACIAGVEVIRRKCVWCCETGNSWKYCYKPILNYTVPVCNALPN